MEKIASFTVDHIRLQPGVYVSRQDKVGCEVVTTFDLRFTSPNEEPVINTAEIHTIEHLAATYLRSSALSDNIIYFGPMGCRTGFYLLVADLSAEQVIKAVQDTFNFISAFSGKIPGTDPIECGNYLEHDLATAIKEAKVYSETIKNLKKEDIYY